MTETVCTLRIVMTDGTVIGYRGDKDTVADAEERLRKGKAISVFYRAENDCWIDLLIIPSSVSYATSWSEQVSEIAEMRRARGWTIEEASR